MKIDEQEEIDIDVAEDNSDESTKSLTRELNKMVETED